MRQLEEIKMKENIANSEKKVHERINQIMCIAMHGLCAMLDALDRSVETSEALLFVFRDSSSPLSVD